MSDAEDELAWQMKAAGLPTPQREYRFHPTRRWRFDFAWLMTNRSIAVEVEGGIWSGGAHVRGRHFQSDMEKYNAAGMQGWTVIRVTPDMVKDGRALGLISTALLEPPR